MIVPEGEKHSRMVGGSVLLGHPGTPGFVLYSAVLYRSVVIHMVETCLLASRVPVCRKGQHSGIQEHMASAHLPLATS